MSRQTLKKLAILGALSLGGMAQPAMAQFGLFGGGCCAPPPIPPTICGPSCCAPPPVACPVVPQYVMQPFTETRMVEQIVQRPVCQTKYVDVPETQYRPVVENKVAQVPTVNYQCVTQMQCRQRDVGQWVTQYRCRPTVSPCAYDSRPGLFGALNRGFYSARMAVTPAVVAERTYVPNVITEQIPVTRQVAIPGTRQVAYQVTRMVPETTMRKVAVQEVRMVAERIQQPVTTTTYRPVLSNSATVMGFDPYTRNASIGIDPYSRSASAVPQADPRFAPTPAASRTADRNNDILNGTSNGSGTVSPPPPAPMKKRTSRPDSLLESNEDPNPGVPPTSGSGYIPSNGDAEGEEMVELAETSLPSIYRETGFRGVTAQVETVSSTPSIVQVSKWTGRSSRVSSEVAVATTQVKVAKAIRD